ncbi:MAG: hypothetical protein O7G31_08690 [Calditrichaeota bacterium]|nr:hypothetical protein [Calditrichota bacterium]
MKNVLVLFAVLLLLTLPGKSGAQWAVAPEIVISIPQSNFANVGETGGGFGIKAIRSTKLLDHKLELRGDFVFLTFGKETTFVTDGIQLIPIEARNEGFRLTVGPQYRFGGRSLKFYLGANGGLYYFRTNITAQVFGAGGTSFFQDSDNNNWSLGWNGVVGLQYDIGLGPWLDLSFEYQTMYNLPESIADDASEEQIANIKDITANEYTIKFGVIFFLGR